MARPNTNGSSAVERKRKSSTPPATPPACQSLVAQTCTKSRRLPRWETLFARRHQTRRSLPRRTPAARHVPSDKASVEGPHSGPQQVHQIIMFEFESVLEAAIGRLPSEAQPDFRALHNAHKNDGSGPLLGIVRTNGYRIENLNDDSDKIPRYAAICKIGSRINHSCIPNMRYHFKLNSFSMQFYAMRDIKAGEQFFSSYCLPDRSLAQRR